MITYAGAIDAISEVRGDAVCVTTMTQSGYWNRASERPELDIGISNGMSKASSVGFGIALARPDRRVLVLDGDGSLLMNLGSLATIAGKAPPNVIHFVFNNGIYAVTGGQPVPNTAVDYCGVALACGYRAAHSFDDFEDLKSGLAEIADAGGPVLVEVRVKPEPASQGYDQTWESNARMPAQMRSVRRELTGRDDWPPAKSHR